MIETEKPKTLLAYATWWISALLLFYYLDYWQQFHMRPMGIHFMRQTDSLSMITHYLKTGMHFWEPGILNLEGVGGKTASEFPVFYYLLAWVFKLTGEHEALLRILNTAFVFAGYFGVYRIAQHSLRNIPLSLAITLLLFNSMVVLYYANNFLPDAAALGISLWGMYYLYRYVFDNPTLRSGISGLGLTLFAALLKVSFLIYPTAFLCTLIYRHLFIDKQALTPVIRQHGKIIGFYLAGLIAVIGWVLFVQHYNAVNQGYFLVKPQSYFKADDIDRMRVMQNITGWWIDSYYPIRTQHLLMALAGIGLISVFRSDSRWLVLSLFSLLGSVAFFFLFFLQFRDHDYYFMAMVPTIVLLALMGLQGLKSWGYSRVLIPVATAVILYVGLSGLAFSKNKMWQRYAESRNDPYSIVGQKLDGADCVLDSLGISRDAKLLVVIDRNMNGGLYFMQRFGWPVMDTVPKFADSIPIRVRQGAEFFVVLDTAVLHHPRIHPFLGDTLLTDDRMQVIRVKRDSLFHETH